MELDLRVYLRNETFFYQGCVQTCHKCLILLKKYSKQTKQNNRINSIKDLLFKVCQPSLLAPADNTSVIIAYWRVGVRLHNGLDL